MTCGLKELEETRGKVRQLQHKCKDYPRQKRELEAKRNELLDQKKEGQRRESELKTKETGLRRSAKNLDHMVYPLEPY